MDNSKSQSIILDIIAQPRKVGQATLRELLSREELSRQLRLFFQQTGLTCAIYDWEAQNCLITIGQDEAIAACQNFCACPEAREKIFPEAIAQYAANETPWPLIQRPQENFYCAMAPLLDKERCLAFLLISQIASCLDDCPRLPLAICFLHTNLRHQLQAALAYHQQEEKLRQLKVRAELLDVVFAAAPYSICISRLGSYEYIAGNPAFLKTLGMRIEESARYFSDAVKKGQEQFIDKLSDQLKQNGRIGPVEVKVSSQPCPRYISFNAKTFAFKDELFTLSITLDITARRQLEEALREKEELFSSIFEKSPMPIIISLVRTNRHVKANRAYYDFSGYSEEEVIDRTTDSTITLADKSYYEHLDQEMKTRGRLDKITLPIKLKSGNTSWILFSAVQAVLNGEPHIISNIIDIDQRIRAEQALKVSEERYHLVADLTGQIHYERNTLTNNIEWTGRSFAILGYTIPQLAALGFNGWQELIHPNEREQVKRQLLQAQEKREKFHAEYRLRRADNTYAHIEEDGFFLGDEPNKIYHMIGVCKDITARKKGEIELRQRNEELIHFTYAASHDLRSPLITIKAHLMMLAQAVQGQNFALAAKQIASIRAAATKMTALLDEILMLLQVGRIVNPPQEIALQKVVQEACKSVEGRLLKHQVEVCLTDKPIVLYGDRIRLVELFQNLLDNAAKFSGAQTKPRVEIEAEFIDDDWFIYVRDNGIGIEPNKLEKIFNLFEKIDSQKEGTGIGLALVKRIVEIHGGTIVAQSAGLGQGTTFRFNLAHTTRANL